MTTIEAIWKQAERDLIIPNADQQGDVLLWEHCSTIARSVQQLLAWPAIAARSPSAEALVAAALYHDAYFAVLHRGRGFRDNDCVTRAGDATARDHSAEILTVRLKGILDAESLDAACEIVREAGRRECRRIEAQILSDVDNLHQLGLLTLLPTIRQSVSTGKGAADLIDRWRVWKEYGVWPARRESFYFPETQHLATQRVEAYDRFIAQLTRELEGVDLAEVLQPQGKEKRATAS